MAQGGPLGWTLLTHTAKAMHSKGGLRAWYRGWTLGLLVMFPYSAIDHAAFEAMKTTYTKHWGIQPGAFTTGVMGALSGAVGATVVYPLNVLRTRLQIQGTHMHPHVYTDARDVARKILKSEGIRGFYRGLALNLMKIAPALSITWMAYQGSKQALNLA